MSAQWETLLAGRAETAGLASAQVKLARCLLANRKITSEAAEAIHPESRPDRLFICEGLWAAEKLCQARIPVTHFLFSPEMAGALSPADRAQCACMLNYAAETFIISKKACEKISERDGADFCFLIAELPEYTLQELETRLPEQTVIMVLDGQEQPGNIAWSSNSIWSHPCSTAVSAAQSRASPWSISPLWVFRISTSTAAPRVIQNTTALTQPSRWAFRSRPGRSRPQDRRTPFSS